MMSKRLGMRRPWFCPQPHAWMAVAAVFGITALAVAGGNNNNNNNGANQFFGAVGGVRIDASGVLSTTNTQTQQQLKDFLERSVKPAEGDLASETEIRMVSLKGLEQAIRDAGVRDIESLPEEVRYLAGLQRIQYVFLFPEKNDIVLAGPAEGWKVSEQGDVIGVTTGRPVLQLVDLMTALKTSENAASGFGISVSIDPTAEGRQRFQQVTSRLTAQQVSPRLGPQLAEVMGPQEIKLTGVPGDSRYARILVAADYSMKRLAMDLEEAPVANLPSFIDLLQKRRSAGLASAMPRWWLACHYEPVAKSGDGLAYELRGQGVKAMTEDEIVNAQGDVKGTGKVNPIAQKWADSMTARYDELSVAQPVFGELRNIMDMSVIAALIDRENMLQHVGLELPLLSGKESLETLSWPAPKQVATQCSLHQVAGKWVVSASGGVQVDSWGVAERQVEDNMVALVRRQADAEGMGSWWWN